MATSPLRSGDPGDTSGNISLGAGGIGPVCLASDPQGRRVAIKVSGRSWLMIRSSAAGSAARLTGRGRGPGSAPTEVIDADPEHATPYLVVDDVDGAIQPGQFLNAATPPIPPPQVHGIRPVVNDRSRLSIFSQR